MKYVDIVPLIGGMSIAMGKALGGTRPEAIVSYSPFEASDSHLLNYYNHEVPYIQLDKGGVIGEIHPDIVAATCPCSGLSQAHNRYGDGNPNNEWMIKTAKYVLGEVKPEVFWGENAPALITGIGKNVRAQLHAIAKENGYAMSIYKTKSKMHGGPQIRQRTFYFFWKRGKVPLMNRFDRQHQTIEECLNSVTTNFQHDPINKRTPTKDDPYYRYILDKLAPECSTHADFVKKVAGKYEKSIDLLSYIQGNGPKWTEISPWMIDNGFDREAAKCDRRQLKVDAGKGYMRHSTIIPRDHIGAFVIQYPACLTHPTLDRYITYREAMTIMGLPSDFELLNPEKSSNHICQNVPIQTATDLAGEVVATLNDQRDWIDASLFFQYNTNGKTQVVESNSRSYEMEGI